MIFLIFLPLYVLLTNGSPLGLAVTGIWYLVIAALLQKKAKGTELKELLRLKHRVPSAALALLGAVLFFGRWSVSPAITSAAALLHLPAKLFVLAGALCVGAASIFAIDYLVDGAVRLYADAVKNPEKIVPVSDWKAALFIGVYAVLFSLAAFNSNPFNGGYCYTDSGVFRYMGRLIASGGIPYRDSFDHKGPVIYLLNWLAQAISPSFGLWIVETVSIALTFYIGYKIARLVTSPLLSAAAVLIAGALLPSYTMCGNYTEEYAMLPIAAAVYIFMDYFRNGRVNAVRLVLCGFGCAYVLMMRPNMVAVWAVFCIAVLVECILRKKPQKLIGFLGWFLAGMLLLMVPILAWLAANGALQDFWYDYIVFNGMYSASTQGSTYVIFKDMTETLALPLVFLCLFPSLFRCLRKKDIPEASYLLAVLLSLLLIVMPGRNFDHYYMTLVPLTFYPVSALLQLCRQHCGKTERIAETAAAFLLLAVAVVPNYEIFTANVMQTYETDAAIDYIRENTDEDDLISVCGNEDYIYLATDRMSASKYSFQYPIAEVDEAIADEYLEDLRETLPKMIVVGYSGTETGFYDRLTAFTEENGYTQVTLDSDYILYERG